GNRPKAFSEDTARAIDEEVRQVIDECYSTAKRILTENEDKLHAMAEALIEYETITAEQIDDIMAGAKPRAPGDLPPPASRGTPRPQPGKPGEAPVGGPA